MFNKIVGSAYLRVTANTSYQKITLAAIPTIRFYYDHLGEEY